MLVSALLLGLIVVGTLTGLNSANRATSIDRERSQADALAQQDEDRLRSLPTSKLTALSENHEVVLHEVSAGGTTFKVESSAKYIVDNTATTNCSSTAPSAEYIQTTSKVTWQELGKGLPVVETGIISPPPETSLIAQVTGPSGEALAGMEVKLAGPSNASATTSTNGCAVLAVPPGEYVVNVKQTGFVDQNWIAESEKDSFYQKSVYLPAETTTKKSYVFGLAAKLNELTFKELNPKTGVREPAKALNAVIENSKMTTPYRFLRPEGSTTYVSSITTGSEIFPFPKENPYSIYAGVCRSNKPPSPEEPTKVAFMAGKSESAEVLLPSLIVQVSTGAEKETFNLISTAPEIFLSDTDKGCEETYHQVETVAPTKEFPGALKYPGQPWGTYTVCVNVSYENAKKEIVKDHFEQKGQKNNHPKQEGTVVKLYEGGPKHEGLEEKPCP